MATPEVFIDSEEYSNKRTPIMAIPNMTYAFALFVSGLFILCAASNTSAQGSGKSSFTLKQIGPNVWAAIGPGGQSNAGFVIGDDGVAVIDTFVTAEADGDLSKQTAATELLAEISQRTKLPVRFVINTHYHLDHVAGNNVFVAAGASILAHRNVRNWIRTENLKLFGNALKPEQKSFIEALAPPTMTFDQSVDLYLGSRAVQVRSLAGHTGGDCVVLIPDAKVAFLGDLFWRHTLPNLMDASTQPWIDSMDTLIKTLPDYTFVSGHGDVGNFQDIVAFRDYLSTLRKLATDAHAQGNSNTELAKAVMPVLRDKYGEWDFFGFFAEPNILAVAEELNGTKKTPQTQ
jgi:cyclase